MTFQNDNFNLVTINRKAATHTLLSVLSISIIILSICACCVGSMLIRAGPILSLILETAFRTPFPKYLLLSPSLSSTASCLKIQQHYRSYESSRLNVLSYPGSNIVEFSPQLWLLIDRETYWGFVQHNDEKNKSKAIMDQKRITWPYE